MFFLLLAAGAGALFATGKVSREGIKQLFSPEEKRTAAAAAETAPVPVPDIEETTRLIIEQGRALEQKHADEAIVVSGLETRLYALQSDVDGKMAALDKERGAFEAERAKFQKDKEEFEKQVSDGGFKKNLEILQKMDPKDAARTIYNWKDEEILRYFRQMKAEVLTELVAELNKYPAKEPRGRGVPSC